MAEKVVADVFSILIGCTVPLSSREIEKKYRDLYDCNLEYRRLGFPTLDALLQDAKTDKIKQRVYNNTVVYSAERCAETGALQDLISRQKKKSKKANKFSTYPANRANLNRSFQPQGYHSRGVPSTSNHGRSFYVPPPQRPSPPVQNTPVYNAPSRNSNMIDGRRQQQQYAPVMENRIFQAQQQQQAKVVVGAWDDSDSDEPSWTMEKKKTNSTVNANPTKPKMEVAQPSLVSSNNDVSGWNTGDTEDYFSREFAFLKMTFKRYKYIYKLPDLKQFP